MNNTGWSNSDRERQIYHLYVESEKKNETNELTYKTEIESQLQKINLWSPGEKAGVEERGINWDTVINKYTLFRYKIDN